MPKRTHRNPDHVQRHNTPSPNNDAIANYLEALLTPAIWAQQAYYRQLGLRDRILNLPMMVAVVLTLLWRLFSGRARVNSLTYQRKLNMGSSDKSNTTSTFRTLLDVSCGNF